MIASSLKTAKHLLPDAYLFFLKYLKREQKIQIVYELAKEIANNPEERESSLCAVDEFCGAWKSEKSTEEIISEIRDARLFDRKIEAF